MQSLLKRYSLFELVQMLYFIIRTKFTFRNARIIRFPIDIRGKKYIKIGKGFTTGRYCRIEAYPIDGQSKVLKIGENVQMNDFVHITAMRGVEIGNNVLMAGKIYISDCSHGAYAENIIGSNPNTPPMQREYSTSIVCIKENVWIGEGVSILPGVVIGEGSIVGANSVVTKSISEHSIVVGNPERVIKKYNKNTQRWERFNEK